MGVTDLLVERLGPYEVEGLIRRGGMGVVYRARHTHLKRVDALKVLQQEYAEDEGFRERFIREAQSAAALHHPNIVTVYDAGEEDGFLYMAMQYIDGPDLGAVLHRDGPLPAARAMWILDQLAQALEAAHTRGLIHRDVKPANVLLDAERCYLADFGLSKPVAVVTSLTAPGQFVGTVHYSAPEQFRAAPLDTRTDVYALGGVLYRMLAGEVAFPGDTEMAVVHMHLYDEIPRLTALRPDLPAAMDDVIYTALAKDREDRYGTCTELAAAANHALKQRSRAAEAPPAAVNGGGLGATRVAEPPTRDTARLRTARVRPRLPSTGVAAALVALGAAGVAAVVIASSGSSNGGKGTGTTVAHTASKTTPAPTVPDLIPDKPMHVGSLPNGLAIGSRGLYIANEGDGSLRRVDPFKAKLSPDKVSVGGGPDAVALGADGIWVAGRRSNTLTRIDPNTFATVAHIPVGHGPNAVAIGTGDYAVWVVNEQDDTVTRIDPNTNSPSPAAPIKVGRLPRAVATTPTYVFVANRGSGTISRINVKSRKVDRVIRTGKQPSALTIANKLLWVANAGDGTVVRVDMTTGKILDRVHVGGRPSALAATRRTVYVADRAGGKLIRLDSVTAKAEGKPATIKDPVAMRSGGGSIWVADRKPGTVTRVELF